MSLLKDNFLELLERIKHGREINHASFEPIYYLIYSPKMILELKRQMPAWIARLHNDGWKVSTFSIAENIISILQNAPLRNIWLAADKNSPLSWEKTNQSLSNMLTNGELESRLLNQLEQLNGHQQSILLITDLEALHPYLRIGVIESQLQGKVKIPIIFFYPGEKTGNTRLKFLGFYPEDGNYRSVHVGGE